MGSPVGGPITASGAPLAGASTVTSSATLAVAPSLDVTSSATVYSPASSYVKLTVSPDRDVFAASPIDHAHATTESAGSGSDEAPPSKEHSRAVQLHVKLASGGRFGGTVTVTESTPVAPPSSVTVRTVVYVPASAYVYAWPERAAPPMMPPFPNRHT